MCGRYVQARATGDLAAALHADHDPDYQHQPSWNIAPTDTVPIVVETLVDGEILRRLGPARWGLLPPWAKDRTFSSRTFNARSETVTTKPSFRSAVRRKRAIVPAEGYYEWRTEGRTKTPHLIRPADGSLMLFAYSGRAGRTERRRSSPPPFSPAQHPQLMTQSCVSSVPCTTAPHWL